MNPLARELPAGSELDYRLMTGYLDGSCPPVGEYPRKKMLKYCRTYTQIWFYMVGFVRGTQDLYKRRAMGYEV